MCMPLYSAVIACSQLLCRDLSLDKCCQYLDLPDSLALNDSCRELMAKSRTFIALQFKVDITFIDIY